MPVFTQTCNGNLLDERAHDGEQPGRGWPVVVGPSIVPSSVTGEGLEIENSQLVRTTPSEAFVIVNHTIIVGTPAYAAHQ